VRILRRVPVRWKSGRRHLCIVTYTFIPGFLLFGPGGEFESKLEFKESSALGDSSMDSTEGSRHVELQ
jgi:hypothetical protein